MHYKRIDQAVEEGYGSKGKLYAENKKHRGLIVNFAGLAFLNTKLYGEIIEAEGEPVE